MTTDEVRNLSYGRHVWVLTRQGDARRVKINGAARTWKHDPNRLEVPVKYGLYEYATFTESDVAAGRLLVEVQPDFKVLAANDIE